MYIIIGYILDKMSNSDIYNFLLTSKKFSKYSLEYFETKRNMVFKYIENPIH